MGNVKKWEKCFIKKHKFFWKINYMIFFTELHLDILAALILELHFCNHIISNSVNFYKHLEHKYWVNNVHETFICKMLYMIIYL